MLSVILILLAAPQETERAFLRSCEMTESGWICRYQIPSVTAVPVTALNESPAAGTPPTDPAPPTPGPESSALAEAEARLIMRCAEASWLSLCLPGERRQARALRDAAAARDERRVEVGRLLGEGRCEDAVRLALTAGDLDLAREARGFCARPAVAD